MIIKRAYFDLMKKLDHHDIDIKNIIYIEEQITDKECCLVVRVDKPAYLGIFFEKDTYKETVDTKDHPEITEEKYNELKRKFK